MKHNLSGTKDKEDILKMVGKKIVAARELANKTQTELAQELNVAQPALSKLESGKTNASIGYLDNLASKLGMRLEINFVKDDK